MANRTFLPPLDFTPRQERVLVLLRLVGPGPAAFFRDALRLIRARESLETATHLAGHCFREIESALRDVLLPDGLPAEEAKKGQGKGDSHRREVMAILGAYGVDRADKVAAMWLRIADKDEDGLSRAAHRNALGAPRPFDDGFQSYCDDLETLLHVVLDRFEANFARHLKVVDDLAATTAPGRDHVTKLLNAVPNNRVTLSRFYEKIDARWVVPLKDGGCFIAAPAPDPHDGAAARYAPWPASSYLARVAPLADEATQRMIGTVAAKMFDTDNPWVNRDLAAIGLSAALEEAVTLARRLTPKLRVMVPGFAEQLSALAERIAGEGQADVAVEIMRALLEVEGDTYA